MDGQIPFGSERAGRWTAVKLLENDQEVAQQIKGEGVFEVVQAQQLRIEQLLGDSAEMIIADHRYGFISGACQGPVRSTSERRHTNSDRIDEIMLHRVWGLPLFLLLMYLVFWLTFTVGGKPMDWIDGLFGWHGVWYRNGNIGGVLCGKQLSRV